MTKRVVIVDYGMGNLWSVNSALSYLGSTPVISSDPKEIIGADYLVLPGVGSFRKAMDSLNSRGISDALREAVLIKKRNILGICLGMQLLAEKGTEDGECLGLGLISGIVERFKQGEMGALKLPHIGFNSVSMDVDSTFFNGVSANSNFYFVHSYRLLADDSTRKNGICNYGINFLAALEHENIFATQFHPEKSQTNGLCLLGNFLSS
jgi:glutamine amidotransferase